MSRSSRRSPFLVSTSVPKYWDSFATCMNVYLCVLLACVLAKEGNCGFII